MARNFFASGKMYRAVVTKRSKVDGREWEQSAGPYDKRGSAQSLLTRMIKETERMPNYELADAQLQEGEVTWTRIPTAYETKLEKARDKFWKEVGDV